MTHSATSGDPVEEPPVQETGASRGPAPGNSDPARRAVRLLLFAAAREAAGARQVEMSATTVGDALEQARVRFGAGFGAVLDGCRVWLNGDPTDATAPLSDGDELAVLPPVSGG